MDIETVVVGEFEVNCYLCYNLDSNKGVIIDPGATASHIIKEVEKIGFEPTAILLTHGHSDHIGAVAKVKEYFNIPLYAGKGEEELLVNPDANLSTALGKEIKSPPPDKLVDDGEYISEGGFDFQVLATPGHSLGGVCYFDEKSNNLFCGDTLFYGSIGRTDFPGCSFETLMSSIKEKILTLPDSIVCYPGHGPKTTVGAERSNNPFIRGDYLV